MSDFLSAVEDASARSRLHRYLDCLERWSSRINLTGADTRQAAIETLIHPVLGAEGLLEESVIDVGSGNGSPGLILAALCPTRTFALLEPRAKRWAFLREAARAMALENVTVRRERSDGYRGPQVRTVTMRAVGLPPEALRPLLLPGGCVLVFGGPLLSGCKAHRLPSGATVQRLCFT